MMSDEEFTRIANERWKEADSFLDKWIITAKDDYAFVSGEQWKAEDETVLDEQGRPTVTFNYSEKMIDAVCGAEVSNRQEVRYIAREVTDSPINELFTEAARWVRDQCNAEDEETDSFRDCLICGLGATRTAMNYEEDADGQIVISRRDPINCRYDPAASKPGLVDRRFDFERAWIDKAEAQRRWPKVTFAGTGDDDARSTAVIQTGNRYNGDTETETDIHKGQVEIRLYECIEKEPYFKVADGQNMAELTPQEHAQMKDQLDQFGLKSVRMFKKVYYRGFFNGETLLEKDYSPSQFGFTLNFMTGKRDRNRNQWYGLTKVMKDPQRWANKWLSQIMHIINSNAKGGVMAEVNAFVDPRQAEDDWAKPDSVILLNEGALSGGKIREKNMSPYPQGLDRLMEFALQSLPMVTGINLEALGLANRDQANVLEQSRKQAAYGLLSPIFDSLKRYRKVQGRVLLHFIKDYISDGRLIRISGMNPQVIPLTKDPGALTYDIVVDQSPTSPDSKQRTWDQLMQIVPVMMKEGLPIPPDLLQYSPLPVNLVQKWQSFLQQQGNINPAMVQQLKQQLQQLQMENQQLQQDQSVKIGELQVKQQHAAADQTLKVQVAQAQLELEKFQLQAELQMQQMKLQGEHMINQQRASHDARMSDQKIKGDLKIKAAAANLNPDEEGGLALKLDSSEITEALKIMAESQKQLGQSIVDAAKAQSEALASLSKAMNSPKTVVRDDQGRPIGIKPVASMKG